MRLQQKDTRIARLILGWFLTATPLFCISTSLPLMSVQNAQSSLESSFLATLCSAGIFFGCFFIRLFLIHYSAQTLNRLGSLLVVGAAASLCAANNYYAYAFFGFLIGIGAGIRWIVCDAWITELGAHARGRTVGLYEAVSGSTLLCGPALSALTIKNPVITFVCCTLIALLSMLLTWNITVDHALDDDAIQDFSYLKAAREQLYAFWISLFGGIFESGSGAVLAIWLITNQGLSESLAALLITGIGIGSLSAQLPLGIITEKYSVKNIQLCCAALLPITSLLLLINPASSLVIPFIVALIWGAVGGGLYTLSAIHLGNEFQGKKLMVSIAAVVISYSIGNSVGPIFGGYALDVSSVYGLPIVFFTLGLCALLTTILCPNAESQTKS
jgi:MFS family permease